MLKTITAVLTAAALFVAAPASGHFYAGCQKDKCKAHVIAPYQPKLKAIHRCEAKDVGWYYDGPFDGGLQFHPSTWNATGSAYDFAYQAPPREQKYRAVIWASKIDWNWRSTAGWPNCG